MKSYETWREEDQKLYPGDMDGATYTVAERAFRAGVHEGIVLMREIWRIAKEAGIDLDPNVLPWREPR
jgi:hypothetical protein